MSGLEAFGFFLLWVLAGVALAIVLGPTMKDRD